MSTIQHKPSNSGPLRVWLLTGPKGGDNAQVRALGQRLAELGAAEPVEIRLDYRPWELLLHGLSRPTLAGLRKGREALVPPWPDLVITAGRRNELPARWVRARGAPHTRAVLIGRPWSRLAAFDLVVSTPQYRVAGRNVQHNFLPLVAPLAARLAAARTEWQATFADLPTPRIGVLLGGDSGWYLFRGADGAALGARLDALCRELGGSLLVTSSRRTPAAFLRELRGKLTVPHFVHDFRPDAARNPYLGILAHANALVVTAESMSMVAEAVATGVPTFLAPVSQPGRRWWRHLEQYRWRAISHRFVQAFAPQRFRRDVTRVHAALEAAGRLRTLEGLTAAALDAAPPAAPHLAELDHTARRVLALCEVSARQRDGESRRR